MLTPLPRTRDHLPPLLRGIGFLLILLTSLVVGMSEYHANAEARERTGQAKARIDAEAATAPESRPADAVAREIRLLRLQLREDDLADKVFENPWFQLLGALGSGLVAVSFLLEAWAKWPRRTDAPPRP
ncbi:MAG: hypothetical protein QM761_08345 [Pseudoxanthomonas sp.]